MEPYFVLGFITKASLSFALTSLKQVLLSYVILQINKSLKQDTFTLRYFSVCLDIYTADNTSILSKKMIFIILCL